MGGEGPLHFLSQGEGATDYFAEKVGHLLQEKNKMANVKGTASKRGKCHEKTPQGFWLTGLGDAGQ